MTARQKIYVVYGLRGHIIAHVDKVEKFGQKPCQGLSQIF
jgi:hypothetical protein